MEYENAIKTDNVEYIRTLLQEHPEYLNTRDLRGRTMLHHAANEGARNIVDHLVDAGANVDIRDSQGHTALSGIGEDYRRPNVEDAYCHIAKRLIDAGADVDSENRFGYTVIYYAVRAGHVRLFDLLVASGADVHCPVEGGHTVFHVAVCNNHRELIHKLKDMDVDIHACKDSGYNALDDALNNPEILALLLSWNVSPHEGDHLLINAVYYHQSEEAVRLLLEAGIDTSPKKYNRKYEEDETALDIAYRKGNDNIIKMIEDYDSILTVKGAIEEEEE